MTANVIGALVLLTVVFGAVISLVGFYSFQNSYKEEYANTTFRMARAATVYVNGNHIDNYLANQYYPEYVDTEHKLQKNSYDLNVTLIYVIKVDESDYNSFISIFNIVNNTVDNTKYSPWPMGYVRQTSNDEYREKYRSLYEQRSQYETVFRFNTTDGQHPHLTSLVPVKNDEGKVTSLLCIQRPISEMRDAFIPYFLYIIISIGIMGLFIVLTSIIFLRKSVIKPLQIVSKEASRFAKEKSSNGSLNKISRYDDLSTLSSSINLMEKDMMEYINDITKITAEKEKISAELSIASQIQQSSLPSAVNAFPNRKDFEIFASMDPAKEVGGDFYNFFLVDEDHLAVVIADVSDKGVPAALFMMVTNILISERMKMLKDPAKVLNYVNDDLCEHNQSHMFVTIWLGLLEISTGKLLSCNAGHEDPFIYKKGQYFELHKEHHGFIAGAMKNMKYDNQEIYLNNGDKLFLYTDGLLEANNSNKEQYSVYRLMRSLNINKDSSPEKIISGVREDIDNFVKDSPQFDDLTMLCVELKNNK